MYAFVPEKPPSLVGRNFCLAIVRVFAKASIFIWRVNMTVKKRMFWQSALFCAILLGVVVPAGAAPIPKFAQLYYGSDDNIDSEAKLESPVLNLDNQSLDVNLTGPNYDSGFGVFFNPTIAESSGTIVMKNGSSLNLFHGDDDRIYLNGISVVNFAHAEVLLDEASNVRVTASAVEQAWATGISLGDISDPRTAIVSLNNKSVVQAKADGFRAEAIGVFLTRDPHAKVIMDNNSSIIAEAAGTGDAGARGVFASTEWLEVTLDSASSISAKATAIGDDSSASAHGLYARVSDLDLTLDNGSLITAESTSYEHEFDGSFGVYAEGDDSGDLNISLDHQSKIEAKTILTGGSGEVYGLLLENAAVTEVTMANSSVIQAIGIASEGSSNVDPTALLIDGINDVTVTLSSGSQLISRQTADPGDFDESYANGLNIYGADSANVTLIGNSKITVSNTTTNAFSTNSFGISVSGVSTLDLTLAGNSLIDVSASNNGSEDNFVDAIGIRIDNVAAANIALTDGSKIIARAQTTGNGEALSYGLYNDDSFNAILTLDATSAISADYAVYDSGGNTTIHNSGLLAGRLDVAAINNSSSGVLQATFGSGDGHAYTGGIDDFYFFANTAELAAGSTFRINPTDNLGLNSVGDTVNYALLQADGGSWNQAELQLTSTFNSSLFGLNWHADSDNNQLIATATFLSPEQVGLSGNATRAFEAAMADGLFTFASDPTAWVPDVSGAFLAGMNQSLANSQVNIGNRLGGLMGLNSGDDMTADNGMWFSARYTDADQDRRHGIDGFSADTTAYSIGFDREFHNVVLGLAYTHGNTDAKTDDRRSKFDMDDNLFSLYGSYDALKWYGKAILSAGFGNVDGKRANGSQVYKSDFDSNSYNAKVEAGMKLAAQGWQLHPLVAMEYSRKTYDSYTESGDQLALHIGSQDYDLLKLGVGTKAHKDFQRSWGFVTPEVYAMFNHDLITDRIVATANFIGGSTSFVAKGIEPSRTSWDLGTALTVAGLEEQNVSFRLGYDYSGRNDFKAHSVTGKLRMEF
jgi:outer membrane autotransporter protein